MTRTMKAIEARLDAAKQRLEGEIASLYARFRACTDPAARAEIKRQIDSMISKIERKRVETSWRPIPVLACKRR
jgi:hypothetical protein